MYPHQQTQVLRLNRKILDILMLHRHFFLVCKIGEYPKRCFFSVDVDLHQRCSSQFTIAMKYLVLHDVSLEASFGTVAQLCETARSRQSYSWKHCGINTSRLPPMTVTYLYSVHRRRWFSQYHRFKHSNMSSPFNGNHRHILRGNVPELQASGYSSYDQLAFL